MKIGTNGIAAIAAAGFGLLVGFSMPASAEPTSTTAKKSANAPVELAKFNKHKTHASVKSKTKTAETKSGAKLADAATRGKTNKSADALDKLASSPSAANAHAELTAGNPLTQADEEARNIAAVDDGDVVVMNGVQIASADQLNDIDRAMTDDKTEMKADDTAASAPAPQSRGVVKAVPSGERHILATDDRNPWSNTSLIGKIFVAFGSLLTLASAARLMIA
ncbi:MAG: hypothetical protein HY242_00520 [Afipia sp.]|nr:hypothetical protein [Afipia sp.]